MTPAFPSYHQDGWTAVFESYDQHGGDLYYVITVDDGRRFMARVDAERYGDDLDGPDLVRRLRQELETVARSGVTNTRYVPFPPLA